LSRLPGKRARPVLRGPRRSNAPGLPAEIVFSVIQRKVITPVDFADLDALTRRLTAFEPRYNATATPFDWRFTRTDLTAMLARIDVHRPTETPVATPATARAA
jgi:hypothetical protein